MFSKIKTIVFFLKLLICNSLFLVIRWKRERKTNGRKVLTTSRVKKRRKMKVRRVSHNREQLRRKWRFWKRFFGRFDTRQLCNMSRRFDTQLKQCVSVLQEKLLNTLCLRYARRKKTTSFLPQLLQKLEIAFVFRNDCLQASFIEFFSGVMSDNVH